MESPSHYPDGPLDQIIDTSHLSEKSKQCKRNAYLRWTVPDATITTAAGQILKFDLGREESLVKVSQLSWKVDGQVSVARISCKKCAEINSCREEGTPPFVCLVRAGGYRRADGTSQCAYCFCNSFAGCKAQCGEHLISDEGSSESDNSDTDSIEDDATPKKEKGVKATDKRPYEPSSSAESDGQSSEDEMEALPTSDSRNDDSNRRYSHSGRALQTVKRFIPIKRMKKKRRASTNFVKAIAQKSQFESTSSSADIRVPVIMVGRRGQSLGSNPEQQERNDLQTLDDGGSLSATSSMTMYHDGVNVPPSTTQNSSVPPQYNEGTEVSRITEENLKQAEEEYEKAAEEVLALKRAKYHAMLKARAA